MKIYPAIDIIDGKCVRLSQGDYARHTIYAENPVEVALGFEQQGAEFVHVVDLDGAKLGSSQNIALVSSMVSQLAIPLQLGGGIRSIAQIEAVISKGIKRVILGTAAVKDPDFVKEALKSYPEHVVIGIDARDGWVAIEGWFEITNLKASEFAKKMEHMGAKRIIFTDIAQDGMLQGPNLKSVEAMVKAVGIEIVVAGGISGIQDVKNCKGVGAAGVVIGKALYTGAIRLSEALEAAKMDWRPLA